MARVFVDRLGHSKFVECCVSLGCGSKAVPETSHIENRFGFGEACVFLQEPVPNWKKMRTNPYMMYVQNTNDGFALLHMVFTAYSPCMVENPRRDSGERHRRRPGNLTEQAKR